MLDFRNKITYFQRKTIFIQADIYLKTVNSNGCNLQAEKSLKWKELQVPTVLSWVTVSLDAWFTFPHFLFVL